jgi:thymidine kinase
MNSGKSLDILKIAHNYKEQGKKVLLFTSGVDTRHGKGKITSRIGLQEDAIIVDHNMYDIVANHSPSCVLVDECQFLTIEQVLTLTSIVDFLEVPVIAYGLKSDFQGRLFEGSEALLVHADKIEELKTVCWDCDKKASMNMRVDSDGTPVFTGESVLIGDIKQGEEFGYKPVCRNCYFRHYINTTGENIRNGW